MRNGLWVLALAGCVGACDAPNRTPQRRAVASAPTGSAVDAQASLLSPERIKPALDELMQTAPKAGRLLSLTALHSQVILQVQDPEKPTDVVEYRYRWNGALEGPEPVTLLGTGKLHDNLFSRQTAAPMVAVKVLQQLAAEPDTKDLKLKKLVMIRNLPRSRDIQFRVFFDGPEGDLLLITDKRGRVLGPPRPVGEE